MKKLIKSFLCAFQGLGYVWRGEKNFRLQTIIAAVLIVFIRIFNFSFEEAFFVLVAITMVLSSEILNTALEKMLDRLEPEHDPLIGKLKDIMAANVLIVSAGAALMGIFVFWHHFF